MPLEGTSRDSLREAIEGHLDKLRPALITDGGNVELLGVDDDGTVRVALQGQCATCPAQLATLKFGLEEPLCAGIPGVTGLIAI